KADGVMFWSRISTFGAKTCVCLSTSLVSVRVSSPIFAGTLQAITGPLIPGTLMVCPPVATVVVWALDWLTGVQVSFCSSAAGIAGALLVFCGTKFTSASAESGQAASRLALRQNATRLFFIFIVFTSEFTGATVARQ